MTAREVIAEALRVDADDPVDSWSQKVWPQALKASAHVVVDAGDLVDVLMKHRWRPHIEVIQQHVSSCECGWSRKLVNTHKTGIRLHAEHVAEMVAEVQE